MNGYPNMVNEFQLQAHKPLVSIMYDWLIA